MSWAGVTAAVFGWLSTGVWVICMYPLVVYTIKRKSVQGLSLDFVSYNVLGFVCYTVFTAAMLWDQTVIDEAGGSSVKANDFVFAAHGMFINTLLLSVSLHYRTNETLSKTCVIALTLSVAAITILMVSNAIDQYLTWFVVLTILGYGKFLASFVKYMPQAWLNYQLKTTIGLHMLYVWLDLTGSVSSIMQMILLAVDANDPVHVFTSNLPKFFLALEGVTFACTFIIQRKIYGLAMTNDLSQKPDERTPLVRS